MVAILMAVRLRLFAAIGFRACQAVIGQFHQWLPQFRRVPAPNTTQDWLLRLGLHELTRVKERADDWVYLVDYTMQLGEWKCLVIVGVRASAWRELDRPLEQRDLSLLVIAPTPQSGGDHVCQQLRVAASQTGVPAAILSDQGTDLTKGISQFREAEPRVRVQHDLAHKAALSLKRELLADVDWERFLKHCGRTQPQVKQTELGHLAPPTLKVKARYMNLSPLIDWGGRLLTLIDTPVARRPAACGLARLDEKFGWIRQFRAALDRWRQLRFVIDAALTHVRAEGYHVASARQLASRLSTAVTAPAAKRLRARLLEFIREQSGNLPRARRLPGTSEVLESLLGKGKQMQGQHSRGGFTKMLLGIAAAVAPLTPDRIHEALSTIKHADIDRWRDTHLGPSLITQRRQALPTKPTSLDQDSKTG